MKNKARNLRKLQSLLTAVFIVGMIFTATSCKDDEGELEEIVASDPEITNIMESSGYIGDEVTINGENFNDGASETVVKFGTVNAAVTGGTTTTIETSVPDGVSFGSVDVTVTVSDLVSESESFTVLDPDDSATVVVDPMVFTDFTPKVGEIGTTITLSGENLYGEIQVYINDVLQTEENISTDGTGTTLSFDVVEKTYTGKVEIKRGEEELEHEELFTRENLEYSISDFNNSLGGKEIVLMDDGSFYLSSGASLYKVGFDGVVSETLIDSGTDIVPDGLFLANSGVLYIADINGQILYIDKDSSKVDTLITGDPNIGVFGIDQLTGDNEGFLYATGETSGNVLKVDLNKTVVSSEIIATVSGSTIAIAVFGDSLIVTTKTSMFKIHKDSEDGVVEYIVPESDGYDFSSSDICVHPSGNLIVVSQGTTGGIYEMTPDYVLEKKLDDIAQGAGLDQYGNVYVTNGSAIKVIEVN